MNEEDSDIIEDLVARLDAHRLIIGTMLRHIEDRDQAVEDLTHLEELSRKNNLATATIQEIADMRDMLDDL